VQESPTITCKEKHVTHFSRRILLAVAAMTLIAGAAACGPKGGSVERSAIERDDDMAIGEASAPVTLVEYASLTCPHCATFHATIFPEIKEKYIDTGKVRFVFRQFPTPPARLAVGGEVLARCKGDSETYYKLLGLLFEKQRFWIYAQSPAQALRDIGATVGVSADDFDACLADDSFFTRIQEVGLHAQETWNINSTPQFVINGELAKDMNTAADFVAKLDAALAGEGK
jgi:protein-disulfide isomerase